MITPKLTWTFTSGNGNSHARGLSVLCDLHVYILISHARLKTGSFMKFLVCDIGNPIVGSKNFLNEAVVAQHLLRCTRLKKRWVDHVYFFCNLYCNATKKREKNVAEPLQQFFFFLFIFYFRSFV